MAESNNPSNFFSATLCSSNILLDEHKVTKVGDFGLAKAMPKVLGGRSYITCAAHGGSLGYQAPEILEGEISPKFDVYSLGVVRKQFLLLYNSTHDELHACYDPLSR